MKQILVELSKEKPATLQVEEIQQEWGRGVYGSMLIHVFSGLSEDRFTSQIAATLQECFPEAQVVGTMSAGEIKDGRLMQRGMLVSAMLFEETDVRVLRYDRVKGSEEAIGRKIRLDLEAIDDIRGAELLFPGSFR